jgi:hypothetical protein
MLDAQANEWEAFAQSVGRVTRGTADA